MKTYKILDADVFLQDFEHGKGKIIISDNYGHNYSYYWGAMGEDISSFILGVSEDYFINKLMSSSQSETFDCKASFTALRKFIREEGLNWYEHTEFQKDMRFRIKQAEIGCEDERCFVDLVLDLRHKFDYWLIDDEWERKSIELSYIELLNESWHFICKKPSVDSIWLCKLLKELKKELKKQSNE